MGAAGAKGRLQTEDRGVCAKTERESKDGNDGERWTFQQTADANLDVSQY